MRAHRHLSILAGLMMMTALAGTAQVRTGTPGAPVERHVSSDQLFQTWSLDSKKADDAKKAGDAAKSGEAEQASNLRRIKVCRVETVCKMRFREGQTPRTRVRNLVVPVRYEDENVAISEAFTKQVEQALSDLSDKHGVSVRFVGYTDDRPLSGREESTYADQLALSKAMARRVALASQKALGLPSSAIESDGRGATHPVASNETAQGRALNRRVEVEFWYDDVLQELPEEPQLCPGDEAREMTTKSYDPPWGSIPRLELADGKPVIPEGFAAELQRALNDIANRKNARLLFIGYTKNERLDRRTASIYGDDIGLSAARARRAMESVMQDPSLAGAKAEVEGRGYVQSADVVNVGFTQGQDSFVRVEVVYDEPLPLDDYENIDIERITRELHPKSAYALNVMHITVDGKPVDDPGSSISDVERCTDVALDKASIQLGFDDLKMQPRLAVAAEPVAIEVSKLDGSAVAPVVHFQMYTNYASFIDRAEIRIFEKERSLESEPLAIVPVDDAGRAEWQPSEETLAGPAHELKYLLRAYGSKGNFDETGTWPLWLNHEAAGKKAVPAGGAVPGTLLAAYGESDLVRHRIALKGGTVSVQGSDVPANHTVWVAGHQIPVDKNGKFAAEAILPEGTHTVEVAVLDEQGNGSLYLRDLEFKRRDMFFVGIADFTFSQNSTSGPIDLLQGENAPQPIDSNADGRLAFYLNGKATEKWNLTASADTREGPVQDIFTNFLDKSPDALFRRIDPDYFYPTFGDDGVVKEMAPTLGKFYVKASRGRNYGMWGNFKVGYMGNELATVDRAMYGGNGHYESDATTRFGEKKAAADGFAGAPGTKPSYEEFRGTGGSLYYLQHQDILTGSERVRIEVHDKVSGIVTGVVNLQYPMDYDIDYLQGRILLTEPLSSTASDNLLVRNSGLSGDEAYLVVRYEYTPGFESLDEVAVGGQGHYWLNDHIRIGLTGNTNQGDSDSSLGAGDVTLRKSVNSWAKFQIGRSSGLLSEPLASQDGGFGFSAPDPLAFVDADALGYRADFSFGVGDFFKGHDGRTTFYVQNLEAGYSAPGQATTKDTRYYGGTFTMPVTKRLSVVAKGDQKTEELGLESRAIEVNAVTKLTNKWILSTGVRNELREDHSVVVPPTQIQGERTDAIGQVTYKPGTQWQAYGFYQGTLAASDGAEDNRRIGGGGSFRPSERYQIDGEVSDGDLGFGAKFGSKYLISARTSVYLNYALENERTDNGLHVGRGNLTSGVKNRLTDTSSVYVEERYQDHGSLTGLTHATGIHLVARERWNLGASGEFGNLFDSETGAETNRKAAGVRLGYGSDSVKLSSGVEYRRDNSEQLDTSRTLRTTWLFRNNIKVILSPDWRIIGKVDYSNSDSSQGEFYDGGYTEAVLGWAYRPVRNDRLNALAKYTFFSNVPTTDQVTAQNIPAEFIQKSHIAALDVTYDLTSTWSVGGKYAYRLGEVALDRENRVFFDNTARLWVLRGDWRFRKGWESLVEGRVLDLPDLNQRRRGVLTAVYRYLGKNLKVGVGYNFTDFSDDLTDLDYDHRGVFFNILGTK